jgi:hypothetical protein
MMQRFLPTAILLLIAHASSAEKPSVCKTTAIASSCYQTHGRLAVYNGGAPNFRLWQIGTSHLLGIFTDAQDMRCTRGLGCPKGYDPDTDESRLLPRNLQAAFHVANPFDVTVFADFEVCPLERHIPGHMQAACIESAKHIFVQK